MTPSSADGLQPSDVSPERRGLLVNWGFPCQLLAVIGTLVVISVLLTGLESQAAVLALTAVGLASTAAGFFVRRSPVDSALYVVAAVFAFAYLARYFAILADPELIYFLVPSVAWPAFEAPDTLHRSLTYSCAAFLAAAGTASFLRLTWLGAPRFGVQGGRRIEFPARDPGRGFLFVGVLAIVLLDSVMIANGIGVQGQFVEQPLPFKLTGAIVYLKSIVVPCFAMVYIYCAERRGLTGLSRVAISAVLLSGAADMILFSSRGALLLQVLFVALLWRVAGFKVRKSDAIIAAIIVTGALLAVPIITATRLFGTDLSVLSFSQIMFGVSFVFFRVTGIDQFMVIIDLARPIAPADLLEVLWSPRGVAGYYTSEVLAFPEDVPQTFAPSALGWLYLVGGVPGLLLGGVALAGIVFAGWRVIELLLPRLSVIAKAYFMMQLIVICTEGVIGVSLKALMIALFAFWALERTLAFCGRIRAGAPLSPSRSVSQQPGF